MGTGLYGDTSLSHYLTGLLQIQRKKQYYTQLVWVGMELEYLCKFREDGFQPLYKDSGQYLSKNNIGLRVSGHKITF